MTTLITLLISLLGYGTPSDFSHMTEDQLVAEIEMTQSADGAVSNTDGGDIGEWDIVR